MKAVVHRPGVGLGELFCAELAEPTIAPGHVKVRVTCASLGEHHLTGMSKAGRPYVPGTEFTGQVVATSPEVTGFEPGDHVFGLVRHGALAELVIAPTAGVFVLGPGTRAELAAALPVSTVIASFALEECGASPGERVVVSCDAGPTALILGGLARLHGLRPIAVARHAVQVDALASAYDEVVLSTDEPPSVGVLRLTDGAGVPYVLDLNGALGLDETWRMLTTDGTLVRSARMPPLVADSAQALRRFDALDARRIEYDVMATIPRRFEEAVERVREVLRLAHEGRINVPITRLAAADVEQALPLLRREVNVGRIVIDF